MTDLPSVSSRSTVLDRNLRTPRAINDLVLQSPMKSCAICLEVIKDGARCYAYACFHQFCLDCLTKWCEVSVCLSCLQFLCETLDCCNILIPLNQHFFINFLKYYLLVVIAKARVSIVQAEIAKYNSQCKERTGFCYA